jgi:hypothetical protein
VTDRFFVDENDLALGKALAEAHGDVVYPGHPNLPKCREEPWTTTGSRSSVNDGSSSSPGTNASATGLRRSGPGLSTR